LQRAVPSTRSVLAPESPLDRPSPGPAVVLTPQERAALSGYAEPTQAAEKKSLLPGTFGANDFELTARALFESGFLVEGTGVDFSAFKEMLRVMLLDYPRVVHALEADFHARPDYRPDLFVNHMMDLERTFASAHVVPFAAQQEAMQWLDFQWGGKLICFTAFDPFRRDQALASVEAGLQRGAVGIKFYPPSGYRPWDNAIPPPPPATETGAMKRWRSRYEGLTGADLDAQMRQLFAKAEYDQIPIFTHCTSAGFEAVTGYGWNADPEYWAHALEKFPRLRLCFGHAGGTQFWFHESAAGLTADDQRAWKFGEQVVQLCLDYPNVYCEFAFLEPLLTPDGAAALKKRLAATLGAPSHSKVPGVPAWKFGDKVMYGTDWHMITQVKDHERYLEACDEIISAIDHGAWQRKFFAGNAVNYLQLAALAERPDFQADRRSYWKDIVTGAK
jgi:predicted TIM-barrel fold metal-dependent hydrolase